MERLRRALMKWYDSRRRDLPWRQSQNPYHIWLSEVILQQTRVVQGKAYYERFIERFPDLNSLALAEEGDVLKEWEGLGYYSRARNLHKAARQVLDEFGGEIPSTYSQLLTLKGVGPYTAAAVASIAFGEAVPAIDGNVARVISRLFAIDEQIDSASFKEKTRYILEGMIDEHDPGTFNQAIMEFGALHCVPANPSCHTCPIQNHCLAFESGNVGKFPQKKIAAPLKIRHFNYLVVLHERKGVNEILLQRREQNDIWHHLFEFPLVETKQDANVQECIGHPNVIGLFGGHQMIQSGPPIVIEHLLSHQKIIAKFHTFKAEGFMNLSLPKNVLMVPFNEIHNYPMSKLMLNFLTRYQSRL